MSEEYDEDESDNNDEICEEFKDEMYEINYELNEVIDEIYLFECVSDELNNDIDYLWELAMDTGYKILDKTDKFTFSNFISRYSPACTFVDSKLNNLYVKQSNITNQFNEIEKKNNELKTKRQPLQVEIKSPKSSREYREIFRNLLTKRRDNMEQS